MEERGKILVAAVLALLFCFDVNRDALHFFLVACYPSGSGAAFPVGRDYNGAGGYHLTTPFYSEVQRVIVHLCVGTHVRRRVTRDRIILAVELASPFAVHCVAVSVDA